MVMDAEGARPRGAGAEGAGPASEVLPLVVLSEAGSAVDVAWMNAKGFNKSREQGVLWTVHDETGRLLPYAGNTPFLRIVKRGRWYEAIVSSETAVDLANAEPTGEAPEPAFGGGGPGAGEPPSGKGSAAEGPRPSAAKVAAGGSAAAILEELAALIRRRKEELPEGSYTSYLFKSGVEKIRKKTGEEAIELVLARERREVVSESADLIYHLLVYLTELGIDLSEVLAELEGRSK